MTQVIVTRNRAQAIILNELLSTKTSKRHMKPMGIAELRKRTALSRPHFDAALLALSNAQLVSLMRRDYPAGASESERAEWLHVGDQYFHAVTLRE